MFTAGISRETPLNIDFGMENERQDCQIGTVGRGGYLWAGRVREKMKVREYG
jgi:hypothetical protein